MSRTVVVVGGGYGGAGAAKALDAEADVVLVDSRDAFVNAAASLRSVAQPDFAPNMFFPFDALLERGRFVRGRVVSADPEGVTLDTGERLGADYIVLATGSNYAYPAKPNPSVTSAAQAIDDLRVTHKEVLGSERVLILGAGPVGLELGGEIKEVWPEKHVTIVDPAPELLPGFLPSVREDLQRQLAEKGIEVRLGTSLTALPPTGPGRSGSFTVGTTAGDEITADIWFRAFGVQVNSDYLADGKLVARTERGTVAVTEHLRVDGHEHVYALGDITDLAEAKMAGYAMQHAEIVAQNILAQIRGEQPAGTYAPAPDPMILLPLGPTGGVGQLPMPDGTTGVGPDTVSQYKGTDLFTGKFLGMFGKTV